MTLEKLKDTTRAVIKYMFETNTHQADRSSLISRTTPDGTSSVTKPKGGGAARAGAGSGEDIKTCNYCTKLKHKPVYNHTDSECRTKKV